MSAVLIRMLCRLIAILLGQRRGEAAAKILLDRLPRRLVPMPGPRAWVDAMGLRWCLDTRDNLQRTLYYTGSYDMKSIETAAALVPDDGVVIDVGANIGSFALPLARHASRGRVVAIEPAPEAFDRLAEHVASNHLHDNIILINSALGAACRKTILHPSSLFGVHDLGTWSIYGEETRTGVEVNVVTGDDLVTELKLDRIDLVKVDVEGAEMEVLRGLETALLKYRPYIVCEVVPRHQERAGRDRDEVTAYLGSLGFTPRAIRVRGLVHVLPTWSGNVLFQPPYRSP